MEIIKTKCKYCQHESDCNYTESFTIATNNIEEHSKKIGDSNDKGMSLVLSLNCRMFDSKPDPNYLFD